MALLRWTVQRTQEASKVSSTYCRLPDSVDLAPQLLAPCLLPSVQAQGPLPLIRLGLLRAPDLTLPLAAQLETEVQAVIVEQESP